MSVRARLSEAGVVLPEPPSANGDYLPVVRHGSVLHVAGQLSRWEGGVVEGPVSDTTPELVVAQAGLACAGRALSAVEQELGSLDLVERVLFLRGFVHAVPGYRRHSRVLDTVSSVLRTAFGEQGRHARSAVGVASLPANGLLEIELVVAVCS
ncbi:RidA family protein [Lentzea sp. JNUCC 0626]|uniref:RidA family protein n=1 Tax=Lentzea sp. JNUCC 0626 TaxID=3367513 RepID=UPI00374975A6